MHVAMYYSNKDVRIEEIPKPIIGHGELLVRIEASGICGTDVLEWYRVGRVPLVLGHEIAGVIEEVGEGLTIYKKGDRISASHHVPCGECHYCLKGHESVCDMLRKTHFDPGGFAEYVRLPAINVAKGVYPLPDEVSFEEATFIEPIACILRGQRLAGLKKQDTVLVIGSGVAGLLHLQVARMLGVEKIICTDIVEYRLEAAKRFGADAAIHARDFNPSSISQINNGRLADIVILCTGAISAINQAVKSVERGGTVLFFAPTDKDITVGISVNDLFWRNEITLTSSYAGSPDEHRKALELIRAKRLNLSDMITHRFSLARTGEGLRLVAEAKESLKVIINPQK